MDGVAVYGWQALLVVRTSDEMYTLEVPAISGNFTVGRF